MPILHWLTREEDLKLSGQAPYRLLETVDEYSYGDMTSGNMLIQGDNLDALKALLPYYAGSVKCIYIDPPYNTKSAFEHYDDNLEHTTCVKQHRIMTHHRRPILTPSGRVCKHPARGLCDDRISVPGRMSFASVSSSRFLSR